MRTVDGYLSRRAQTVWPQALVVREPDGTYTLERPETEPLGLGDNTGLAHHGLRALLRAATATVLLWLALVRPAIAQDGARYPVPGGPIVHTATKSVASLAVYGGLRTFGVKRTQAVVLSTLGVFVLAKSVELAKGHKLGPVDTVHDAIAHSLLVLPLATRSTKLGAVHVGLLVGLCRWSAPREC